MDEEKTELVELEGMSDEGRREFLAKLLAGAGGVVAAGLLASALAPPAEAADTISPDVMEPAHTTPGGGTIIRNSPLRYQALKQGHSFSVASRDLSKLLVQEQLLRPDLGGRLASISLSLSYGAQA